MLELTRQVLGFCDWEWTPLKEVVILCVSHPGNVRTPLLYELTNREAGSRQEAALPSVVLLEEGEHL